MKKKHMWTKQELKELIKVWDSKTAQEIADDFRVSKATIQVLASRFRKLGVKLTKKRQNGYLDSLMKEVAKEMK